MLHPIKALDHVIDSYRDYLRTEFRARDERLQAALLEALDRPLFLAQEPFFSAHTPFEAGEPWEAFGLDDRLAAALRKRAGGNDSYLHQSRAIQHLMDGSGPLVISTGTGSGKSLVRLKVGPVKSDAQARGLCDALDVRDSWCARAG